MSSDSADDFRISPVNIRDEVYRYLRAQIVNHTYPPGFRFDLNELETKLGISRTPLKEALQRLESEGLVEIRPRRGTFVTEINLERVLEHYQVRHALERYVAKKRIAGAAQADLQVMSEKIDQMRALLGRDEYEAVIDDYIGLDHDLHAYIIQLTPNKRLRQIYEQVNTHVQLPRVRHLFSKKDLLEAQQEHDAIQAAIEERDPQAMVEALDTHIDQAVQRMTLALQHLDAPELHPPTDDRS